MSTFDRELLPARGGYRPDDRAGCGKPSPLASGCASTPAPARSPWATQQLRLKPHRAASRCMRQRLVKTVTVVRQGLVDIGDALAGMNYGALVYLSDTDGTLADATGDHEGCRPGGASAWGNTTADKLLRVCSRPKCSRRLAPTAPAPDQHRRD